MSPTKIDASTVKTIKQAISAQRIVDTATKLIGIPSPTQSAADVADAMAEMLAAEGFDVERPVAGWEPAPAVVCRFNSGQPGPILQFNGHLDTVHLPFVPPRVENGMLYGSGSSDMKGGIAAMIEAMRALRETKSLTHGGILITAHDLHESPWGDGHQVDELIRGGYLGDAVLLPEYLADRLSVVGRGLCILEIDVKREGIPVHEVLGGIEQPSVIYAGAEIVRRFQMLDAELAKLTHPLGLRESIFVGQIHGGEIYNQAPTTLHISGTRRWLPGHDWDEVHAELEALLKSIAKETGTEITCEYHFSRDAYEIDPSHPAIKAFEVACIQIMGEPLPNGAKPFVDDGNTFTALGKIPAITHGPDAKGAHTLNEEVPVAELVRVAEVYALTAIGYCNGIYA
ncbi:MAG: M20/M25/M40 family metallo-hydrolase [Planctomycetota bacterium]|nr:M20/M25/M40 family metallo-hydrolase [Planctomycetota bacterium]